VSIQFHSGNLVTSSVLEDCMAFVPSSLNTSKETPLLEWATAMAFEVPSGPVCPKLLRTS
jgi:hypothetical protein